MSGLWLYGMAGPGVDPGHLPAGVAPGAVSLRPALGGYAVFHDVDLQDWTGPAAEMRLASLAGLAPLVERHAAVQGAAHAQAPFVPSRFGSLFSSFDALVAALREAEAPAALARVGDAEEWVVQAWLLPAPPPAPEAADGGAAWLRRKREKAEADRRAAEARRRWLDALADELEGGANAATSLPLPRAELAQTVGETPIVHWALLLPRGRGTDVERTLADRAEAAFTQGLRLRCTGPWPPGSFCGPGDVG